MAKKIKVINEFGQEVETESYTTWLKRINKKGKNAWFISSKIR